MERLRRRNERDRLRRAQETDDQGQARFIQHKQFRHFILYWRSMAQDADVCFSCPMIPALFYMYLTNSICDYLMQLLHIS